MSPPAEAFQGRMRFVEQVIYRAAQDLNSLNVAHELVFETFGNEL